MKFKTILEYDQKLTDRVRLQQNGDPAWKMAVFFAHSGDSWLWVAALILVWLFGSSAWHSFSAILTVSVAGLAVLVLMIKFTIKRQRPPGEWGSIYRNTDPHSFPSGHAARAAMLAVMAVGMGPAWFGWLVLIWAPLVSIARVMTGVHYLSDIVAGFVFGALVGWILLWVFPFITPFFPWIF
ncbi:MAG: phosphatase PAP2 family protein [Anaerolineaceae bacterium]